MKKSFITRYVATLIVALGLAATATLPAQGVTTTTTKEVTSEGTISSFEPQSFVIRSEGAPAPLTYSYTTTTRYVDDSGAVITREMIKPGVPVTVYYTRDGDRLIAGRVIVHQSRVAAPAPVPAAETTTTRTTTTTEQPPLTKKEMERERKREKEERKDAREREKDAAEDAREREKDARKDAREREEEARKHPERVRSVTTVPAPEQVTTETVTTTDGTINSFDPDRIVVKTATSESPVTYRYSKTTEYVDEDGNPVTVDVVRSGLPVTVRYIRQGDGFLANRVIVHRRGGPGAVVRPGPPAGRPLPPRARD